MNTTEHEKSTAYSRRLCDFLFRCIESELETTEAPYQTNWCEVGKPRFAHVDHQTSRLKVFLKCREADGAHLQSLILGPNTPRLEKRKNLQSTRASGTPYFVFLTNDHDVKAIMPVLREVAGPKAVKVPQTDGLLPRLDEYLPHSEVAADGLPEGGRKLVRVSRIERNPRNRNRCIEIFGTTCAVCGFDFAKKYGEIGAGFIEVHHPTPLSTVEGKRTVDPRNDLRPACPNCQEMLHRREPPFAIDELKARISN